MACDQVPGRLIVCRMNDWTESADFLPRQGFSTGLMGSYNFLYNNCFNVWFRED